MSFEVTDRPWKRVSVARLAPHDHPAAIDLLARAFESNPLNRAAVRKASAAARRRCNAHGMRVHLPIAQSHGVVLGAYTGEGPVGALIASPPGEYPFPAAPLGARLRSLLGQGLGAASRWSEVFAHTDAIHPREPHWYLGTLGVHPEYQGQGIGRQLLTYWLSWVDDDRQSAYLETDQRRNVRFYEGAGFQVSREMRVLGTDVWFMNRPARKDPPG